MRCVIYDRETLTPMTVIDVPDYVYRDARPGTGFEMHHVEKLDLHHRSREYAEIAPVRRVFLYWDIVRWSNGKELWLLLCDDPTALHLPPALLPGQVVEDYDMHRLLRDTKQEVQRAARFKQPARKALR